MSEAIWNEADSAFFMRAAPYIVPDRDVQHRTIAELLGPSVDGTILELCCGDGLLAECILHCHPQASLVGFDRSQTMLTAARERLEDVGARFRCEAFDIFALDQTEWPTEIAGIVSSLAIHHLNGPQKADLFARAYKMLRPGGAFIVADIVEPASAQAHAYAQNHWDQTVMRALGSQTHLYDIFERFMADGWNHFREPDPEDQPSRIFDQLQWLRGAGFPNPDVFWMKAGHAIYGAVKSVE